jgi:hypothetical protein
MYFAKVPEIVDGKGIVTSVISADQSIIDSGDLGDPAMWIQTSYNTRGGVHYGQDGKPDGGVALRANYAGVGYTYDQVNDVFYAPQPYPSWSISAPAWLWQSPVPYPTDGKQYYWDEATLSWVLIPVKDK